MEAALKLHAMMANYRAGFWLEKAGARKATCTERDEGTVGSVDAMEAGAVGICKLMVYGQSQRRAPATALLWNSRYVWLFQGTANHAG